MAKQGTFKFVCEDCHEDTWLSSHALNSRFKPRCKHCGSPYISPSKKSDYKEVTLDHLEKARDHILRANEKMGYH